jgi:hypothetical protein
MMILRKTPLFFAARTGTSSESMVDGAVHDDNFIAATLSILLLVPVVVVRSIITILLQIDIHRFF